MHYCYIDFETQVTKTLQLRKMTLRNYLRDAAVLGFAAAIDDEPITWFPAPFSADVLALMVEIVESPDFTVVAHNAAFDVRVMRHSLNLQQPSHVHCTLELACAAFPNQAGGYSLRNLASTLNLGIEKLEIDFDKHTQEEMEKYCKRDVELCRLIHKLCLPRLCPDEVQMAEMCNTVRELWFDIDSEKVAAAFKDFTEQSAEAAIAAMTFLGEGAAKGFGVSDKGLADKIAEGEADGKAVHDAITAGTTTIKSVKPHVIKELLLDNLGFCAQSISRKKINPEKLRENEKVANVIASVEKANKALSHMRRVRVFNNAQQIDIELGYFRATATGRFSSPQPGGRGINGHNLPKRNKRISKALRSIFRFPDGLCAVRGDFANVEYRTCGLITGCSHIINLFSSNPLNDPYLGFGNEATGVTWTKADPVRNGLFKPSVLGLEYLMSVYRFAEELLRNYADPANDLKFDDLRRVCADMKWEFNKLPAFAKGAKTKLKCPEEFVCAAFHLHRRFHEIHPEIGRTARWIMSLLGDVVRSLNPEKAIDRCYEQPNAPPRAQLDIRFAGTKYGAGTKNVEIYLCGWPQPTVVWRDLAMRECIQFGKLGVAITAMHATKGYRPITPNIAIEGPSQSAARIGVVKAHLALRARYPYQYSVHDELMLITEQTGAAVRAAYDALVEVVGPKNNLGFGWAVLVDPSEITVTKSLYEVPVETMLEPIGIDAKGKTMYPKPAVFWDRVRTEPALLERLP